MAQTTLEAVWNDITTLTPEDKAVLRQRLETEAEYAVKLAALFQTLRDKGLVTSEPLPYDPELSRFEPLQIQGEPLSETIMRERR